MLQHRSALAALVAVVLMVPLAGPAAAATTPPPAYPPGTWIPQPGDTVGIGMSTTQVLPSATVGFVTDGFPYRVSNAGKVPLDVTMSAAPDPTTPGVVTTFLSPATFRLDPGIACYVLVRDTVTAAPGRSNVTAIGRQLPYPPGYVPPSGGAGVRPVVGAGMCHRTPTVAEANPTYAFAGSLNGLPNPNNSSGNGVCGSDQSVANPMVVIQNARALASAPTTIKVLITNTSIYPLTITFPGILSKTMWAPSAPSPTFSSPAPALVPANSKCYVPMTVATLPPGADRMFAVDATASIGFGAAVTYRAWGGVNQATGVQYEDNLWRWQPPRDTPMCAPVQ